MNNETKTARINRYDPNERFLFSWLKSCNPEEAYYVYDTKNKSYIYIIKAKYFIEDNSSTLLEFTKGELENTKYIIYEDREVFVSLSDFLREFSGWLPEEFLNFISNNMSEGHAQEYTWEIKEEKTYSVYCKITGISKQFSNKEEAEKALEELLLIENISKKTGLDTIKVREVLDAHKELKNK